MNARLPIRLHDMYFLATWVLYNAKEEYLKLIPDSNSSGTIYYVKNDKSNGKEWKNHIPGKYFISNNIVKSNFTSTTEYHIFNEDILYDNNSVFNGRVPDGLTFDTICKKSDNQNGTKKKISFYNDGTLLIEENEEEYYGGYIRYNMFVIIRQKVGIDELDRVYAVIDHKLIELMYISEKVISELQLFYSVNEDKIRISSLKSQIEKKEKIERTKSLLERLVEESENMPIPKHTVKGYYRCIKDMFTSSKNRLYYEFEPANDLCGEVRGFDENLYNGLDWDGTCKYTYYREEDKIKIKPAINEESFVDEFIFGGEGVIYKSYSSVHDKPFFLDTADDFEKVNIDGMDLCFYHDGTIKGYGDGITSPKAINGNYHQVGDFVFVRYEIKGKTEPYGYQVFYLKDNILRTRVFISDTIENDLRIIF